MTPDFWLYIAFVIGLLISLGLDYAVQPRPVFRRAVSCWSIHSGIWCLGFALELLLFQRPWFGLFNLLGLQLLLIVISNMKMRYLREPFFYTDTEYFWDAIKHPRLYIPFFGVFNTVLGFVLYGGAAVIAYLYESAYSGLGWPILGLVLVGGALLYGSGPVRALSFNPSQDTQRLGFVPAMWRYAQAERQSVSLTDSQAPFSQAWQAPAVLPHLVMVQAESFFDPRRVYTDWVQPTVLEHFDQLAAAGQQGLLQVPSWGANTVRTEYAVLSGVNPDLLGVHQFNPYRRLASHQVVSVANYLRSIGYKTVCVHPYAATFYRRDKAIPVLGFDAFIDINAFTDSDKFGAYISDQALAQKVIELLGTGSEPLFVYVITMENHGPLHWETVSDAEQRQLLLQPLPKGCEDLAPYARHIHHLDLMLAQLSGALAELDRPAGLCVFGDHVPIMSTVYQQLGMPDKATDYLMWGTKNGFNPQNHPTLNAAELSSSFLKGMGFKRD